MLVPDITHQNLEKRYHLTYASLDTVLDPPRPNLGVNKGHFFNLPDSPSAPLIYEVSKRRKLRTVDTGESTHDAYPIRL